MNSTFKVQKAAELKVCEPEQRWLIKELWGAEAVGILGGAPKSCKSYMALSMAVAVASGMPCLDRFETQRTGRVLVFAAEDPLHLLRERLDGICAHSALKLEELDVWVIDEPGIRLDIEKDRKRLAATVAHLKPVLLILDPFVRMHRIDENASGEVAPLLAFLRAIQRREGCAVVLVHHARKRTDGIRDGQALRGTSEFHAWSDSQLFLKRYKNTLKLSVEHRANPSCDSVSLILESDNSGTALAITDNSYESVDNRKKETRSQRQRIIDALNEMERPADIRTLRAVCKMKTETLCRILNELVEKGIAVRNDNGWIGGAISKNHNNGNRMDNSITEQHSLFPFEKST